MCAESEYARRVWHKREEKYSRTTKLPRTTLGTGLVRTGTNTREKKTGPRLLVKSSRPALSCASIRDLAFNTAAGMRFDLEAQLGAIEYVSGSNEQRTYTARSTRGVMRDLMRTVARSSTSTATGDRISALHTTGRRSGHRSVEPNTNNGLLV